MGEPEQTELGGGVGVTERVPSTVIGERLDLMTDGETPGDVLTQTDKRLILGTAEERMKRWPLLGQDRALVVETIRDVLTDPKSSRRTRLMATRVAERLESQNQADDHLRAKWGRIDAGQGTEAIKIEAVRVEFCEPGALPAPTRAVQAVPTLPPTP